MQGKEENSYDGIQQEKKTLPMSLGLWKAYVGNTVLKCYP